MCYGPYIEMLILRDNFRISKKSDKGKQDSKLLWESKLVKLSGKTFLDFWLSSKVLHCCNGCLVLFILFSSKPKVTLPAASRLSMCSTLYSLSRGEGPWDQGITAGKWGPFCAPHWFNSEWLSPRLTLKRTIDDPFCLLNLMLLFLLSYFFHFKILK